MTAYLVAWAVCATVASFVVLAVVVGLEIRDHRAAEQTPKPAPRPRIQVQIPAQRQPTRTSAAAIVVVHDAESFERFLAELIMTPHVEEALS